MHRPRQKNILRGIDLPLVLLYLALVLFGWINIYAAVYTEASASIFDLTQRYGLQFLWIVACIPLIALILFVDERVYYVFAYYIFGALILTLVLTLGIGTAVHGSKSWLALGNFRVQPAEFAKFATALALAKFMGRHTFSLRSRRDVLGLTIILALPIGLILLQNDFGSAIVYTAFLLVLYREGLPGWYIILLGFIIVMLIVQLLVDKIFVVWGLIALSLLLFSILTRRGKIAFKALTITGVVLILTYFLSQWLQWGLSLYLISLCAAGGLALTGVIYGFWTKLKPAWVLGMLLVMCMSISVSEDYLFNNLLSHHHQRRIHDLLGIEDDPLGWGYNVNQSMIAIGSGGLTGKGFLEGTQTKFNFVPEQSTDFIFCTVGEEWGFLGATALIIVFVALLIRILQVAERQKEAFHRIYGYGVAAILLFHFAINIAMTIGLFPVIGIPLPFFSYGGSSLWAFTILLFILVKFDASRAR